MLNSNLQNTQSPHLKGQLTERVLMKLLRHITNTGRKQIIGYRSMWGLDALRIYLIGLFIPATRH